ncbi:hypothetical protein CPB85DRAFT_1025241 [Mucidula mucida]|nr:hypothetical protein CPB85DRAFT_1025241 [Mucidula mucida]
MGTQPEWNSRGSVQPPAHWMAGSESSRASTFESKGITRPNTQHLMLPLVGDSVSWDIINDYTRHSKSVSDTSSSDWTLTRADNNRRRFGDVAPLNIHKRTRTLPESPASTPAVLLLKLQKRKKKLHKSTMDIGADDDDDRRKKFSFRLSTPKSLGRIWGRLTGKGKEDQEGDDGMMDFDAPERIPLREVPPSRTRTRTRTRADLPHERLYRNTSTSSPDLSLKRSQSERRPPPVPRRPLPRYDAPPPPPPITRSMYDLGNAQASAPSLPLTRKSSTKVNEARSHNRSHSHASAVSGEVGAGLQRSRSAVNARRPAGRESASVHHTVSAASSEEANGLQRSRSAVTARQRVGRESSATPSSVFLAFPPPKYQRGRVHPFPLSRTGSRAGTPAPSVQSYF